MASLLDIVRRRFSACVDCRLEDCEKHIESGIFRIRFDEFRKNQQIYHLRFLEIMKIKLILFSKL